MDTGPTANPDGARPGGGGPFDAKRLALWLVVCPTMGALVAWVAVVAQEKFAPWIIFPLLMGVGLGALIVGLMRLGQVGHRATILAGAMVAVAVAVVGQHTARYWAECDRLERQAAERRQALLPYPDLTETPGPVPPANLLVYLRAEAQAGRDMGMGGFVARGWVAWMSWFFDGLLVMAATLAMVIPAMRMPFCSCCGSWYRVTRSGRIDGRTATRLAELAGVELDTPPNTARYRLQTCNAGCGPTGFELSWDRKDGAGFAAQVWLSAEQRDRIVRQLDEGKNGT